MVSNSDDSRSGDRENLPLESAIALQCLSDDLAYIVECLQTLQELNQLVSTCSNFLVEDDSSHNLSIRHFYLLFDMYISHSEMYRDAIQDSVTQLQRTLEKSGG
ncbi:hypothetical protein [Microseira wollei]|uniref:Uncharacterized protein n=1 Tax=Microseira wollei NIES-4236 TaxID=2530354 RepID=A0AAV3XKK1_9CYAN|nr:hypothetical protein [Microseira wollei]GET42111.1 hypothetical protein MiSe_69250 [Microseira wollei NIES-4236]